MNKDEKKKKLVDEYIKKQEELIKRMFTILLRAQRKVDDVAYRKTLDKLKINNI